jgi:hypothetical protein
MTVRATWNASTDPNIASYNVESSPDQGTWTSRANVPHAIPGVNWDATLQKFFWDDATGTVDTWYRLQAVDSLAQVSSWSPPFQASPLDHSYVCGGSMSLAELLKLTREESDTENDPHLTDAEIIRYLNQSRLELYDMLITTFGEDYYTATCAITTAAGTDRYDLPNGLLYSGAPCYYKGLLVEAVTGPNVTSGQPITLDKFNLREKNRFNLPQNLMNFPYMLPRYRLHGSQILFAPMPASPITVNLWYAPKLRPLFDLTDMAEDWGGWLEYVVVDAAIKCVVKQERDAAAYMVRKLALKARIEAAAPNRDLAEPNTVTETQPVGFGPTGAGSPGSYGLWG